MKQLDAAILSKVIKIRKSNSHKGTYGRVLLIGGSSNYGGAIIMATEGAINAGAGLTAVATHSINLAPLHARDPEAMFVDWRDRDLGQLIGKMDVVACGPGLGMSAQARQIMLLLKEKIQAQQTLILDASALDLIAQDHDLLPLGAKQLILTPHQMEWQRLSQIRIPYQEDAANQEALRDLGIPQAILVLKSNHTHVYDGQGQVLVNPIGNPGMATGGMGDTLTGIISALTAQFGANLDSVLAAVYLHSLAGDRLYKKNYLVKPTQLSASLPQIMKEYATD